MPRKKRRNNKNSKTDDTVKNLSEELKECQIVAEPPQPKIILRSDIPPEVMACWPKPKPDVPAIFLHSSGTDRSQLVNIQRLLGLGKCYLNCSSSYLKFSIKTFENYKFIYRYFQSKELPFHTYGLPSTRVMKVVVKNLPVGTDLEEVKEYLKKASIPVLRINRMHVPESEKHETMLVLVVLPNSAEGHKMLRVTHILGNEVKLEPARVKTRQCHRCQRWGHSQRYCDGKVKCVKCAGDHLTRACTKDPSAPPKCANCGGPHTANFKKCHCCPESKEYRQSQRKKRNSGKKKKYTLNI